MNLRKINEEVFIAQDPIVQIGAREIEFVKRQAQSSLRKRARICAHKSSDDRLHEMIIVISAASYIHPHRHINKSESFHILEGEVDVVVFNHTGEISDVIQLGAQNSGRNFFYRLSDSVFHTLLLRSEVLVMHEVTNGPFVREETVLAPFAPKEDQADAVRSYMHRISDQVGQYLKGA